MVTKNVAGMYAQPDRASEQVSQVILGQVVSTLEEQSGWLRIKTPDDYSGWVESRWLVPDKPNQSYASGGPVARVTNMFADVLSWTGPGADILTKAVISTELEVADVRDDWVIVRLPNGAQGALRRFAVELLDRAICPLPLPPTGWEIVTTAGRFVGSPYLWGGVTAFGLDCSGFTQLVYKLHSILLPRDAYLQAQDERFAEADIGSTVPGDLVFFGADTCPTEAGREITHVGIALSGGRFIHSSGGAGVMISELAEPRYAAILKKARRLA